MKRFFAFIISILLAFFVSACNSTKNLIVISPDGAPALAVSPLIDAVDGVDVKIVGADAIAVNVTGDAPIADVCVLPINLALKLIGDGNNYKMFATVTHGNFYFLTETGSLVNLNNPNELIGLTIGVIQLANIPGLTLKAALNELNLPYNELVNGVDVDKAAINLKSITASEIASGVADVYMLPSPVADVKANTTSLEIIGSLQQLYGGDFPQAVIVARTSVIENNKANLKEIINKISGVESFLSETPNEEICTLISSKLESGLTPTFTSKNLTKNVITNCNVRYESVSNGKQKVINFANKIAKIQPNAIAIPSNNFFLTEEL